MPAPNKIFILCNDNGDLGDVSLYPESERSKEYIRKDLYDKLKEKYDTLKSYTEHPWDCQMGS